VSLVEFVGTNRRKPTGTSSPASVTDTNVWQFAHFAQKRNALQRDTRRVTALLRQAGIIDHQKCIGCTNDPVRLQSKLGLERYSTPEVIIIEMMKAVVLAWSKPFRHRLDTFAVTGTNEPGCVKRAHLSSFLVFELLKKRLQTC
jgi:hypothetical protein